MMDLMSFKNSGAAGKVCTSDRCGTICTSPQPVMCHVSGEVGGGRLARHLLPLLLTDGETAATKSSPPKTPALRIHQHHHLAKAKKGKNSGWCASGEKNQNHQLCFTFRFHPISSSSPSSSSSSSLSSWSSTP